MATTPEEQVWIVIEALANASEITASSEPFSNGTQTRRQETTCDRASPNSRRATNRRRHLDFMLSDLAETPVASLCDAPNFGENTNFEFGLRV